MSTSSPSPSAPWVRTGHPFAGPPHPLIHSVAWWDPVTLWAFASWDLPRHHWWALGRARGPLPFLRTAAAATLRRAAGDSRAEVTDPRLAAPMQPPCDQLRTGEAPQPRTIPAAL